MLSGTSASEVGVMDGNETSDLAKLLRGIDNPSVHFILPEDLTYSHLTRGSEESLLRRNMYQGETSWRARSPGA